MAFGQGNVSDGELQQYLPFTVLKHYKERWTNAITYQLQQYLPFTVLKRIIFSRPSICLRLCCNSTYRLRY